MYCYKSQTNTPHHHHYNITTTRIMSRLGDYTDSTKLTRPSPDNPTISEICDFLFIGSFQATDKRHLNSNAITAVVSAVRDPDKITIPKNVEQMSVRLEDTATENILPKFNAVGLFLEQKRLCGEKILVHCVVGISRSTTLVLAYLMKYGQMNLRDAFYFVRKRRTCVRPNNNFFEQLILYEKQLKGKTTVTMLATQHMNNFIKIPDVLLDVRASQLGLGQDREYKANFHSNKENTPSTSAQYNSNNSRSRQPVTSTTMSERFIAPISINPSILNPQNTNVINDGLGNGSSVLTTYNTTISEPMSDGILQQIRNQSRQKETHRSTRSDSEKYTQRRSHLSQQHEGDRHDKNDHASHHHTTSSRRQKARTRKGRRFRTWPNKAKERSKK